MYELHSGIASMDSYKLILESQVLYEMEEFSKKFLMSNDHFLKYYYENWCKDPIHQWSRQWEYPFVYSKIISHFINFNDKNFNILDAGSGITFFPYYIGSKFENIDVYCCDLDENLVDIYKKINQNFEFKTHFNNSNIVNTPYKKEYFDIIYTISVLEHTENFENVIKEFFRLLKPNGMLIITFDMSIDGLSEISIHKSLKLLETILKYFEPDEESFEPLSDLRDLTNRTQDIITTQNVYEIDATLLPWNFSLLDKMFNLFKNSLFHKVPRYFSNMTVYCISLKKKNSKII